MCDTYVYFWGCECNQVGVIEVFYINFIIIAFLLIKVLKFNDSLRYYCFFLE